MLGMFSFHIIVELSVFGSWAVIDEPLKMQILEAFRLLTFTIASYLPSTGRISGSRFYLPLKTSSTEPT